MILLAVTITDDYFGVEYDVVRFKGDPARLQRGDWMLSSFSAILTPRTSPVYLGAFHGHCLSVFSCEIFGLKGDDACRHVGPFALLLMNFLITIRNLFNRLSRSDARCIYFISGILIFLK